MIIAVIWKCYFKWCSSWILLHIFTLLIQLVLSCCCRLRYGHLSYKRIVTTYIDLLRMGQQDTYLKQQHILPFPHQLLSKKVVFSFDIFGDNSICILFLNRLSDPTKWLKMGFKQVWGLLNLLTFSKQIEWPHKMAQNVFLTSFRGTQSNKMCFKSI